MLPLEGRGEGVCKGDGGRARVGRKRGGKVGLHRFSIFFIT